MDVARYHGSPRVTPRAARYAVQALAATSLTCGITAWYSHAMNGQDVARKRLAAGITQKELAQAAGTSRSSIAAVEKGRLKVSDRIAAIVNALPPTPPRPAPFAEITINPTVAGSSEIKITRFDGSVQTIPLITGYGVRISADGSVAVEAHTVKSGR